jgi:WD40 repeat protein
MSNWQSIRNFHQFFACFFVKGNFAITAGTDRLIRYWDLREPADSYRVSSPSHNAHFKAQVENNAVVFDEIRDDSGPFLFLLFLPLEWHDSWVLCSSFLP